MATRIAFLRAINVGGHTVTMTRLRGLVEELGWTGVRTFIASGNLRFEATGTSALLARQLARHLEEALGYPVPAFLRSPSQLRQLLSDLPGEATAPGVTAYVGFLDSVPDREARRRLTGLESDVDSFQLLGTHLIWSCRTTISKSLVTGPRLEKALGQPTTLRGLPTIRRIVLAWADPA